MQKQKPDEYYLIIWRWKPNKVRWYLMWKMTEVLDKLIVTNI